MSHKGHKFTVKVCVSCSCQAVPLSLSQDILRLATSFSWGQTYCKVRLFLDSSCGQYLTCAIYPSNFFQGNPQISFLGMLATELNAICNVMGNQ